MLNLFLTSITDLSANNSEFVLGYQIRPEPYLPGQQLLWLQLHCFFIGCLRLIRLFQLTGCQADENPRIVIVLFKFQNSLKLQYLKVQNQWHRNICFTPWSILLTPYLAVLQSLLEFLVFDGLLGTFQCDFHFFTRHLDGTKTNPLKQ